MFRDMTPFPDQDMIRSDVARVAYRSKIDMSDAYEQVRITPEDVWKTVFSTPFGCFVSLTMQQGDCNAPSTFQRLITAILRDIIARVVHNYLDDIFVFTRTIRAHLHALYEVFMRLRANHLYLSPRKVLPFAEKLDCLGHLIDDQGIHMADEKMGKVAVWRTPRNYNDVLRFLGLVEYLAHFLPDLATYASPLSGMCRNDRPFVWTPLMAKCFDTIKALVAKGSVLKPIDPSLPVPIWLISDASAAGIGALLGQGEDWKTCRPAAFLSKKFSPAQHAYFTGEQEMIGILEGLHKWEDKLLGISFTIVTDHKTLEFFKTQLTLTPRQIRWMDYYSRFNAEIKYVLGTENRVADALSRYYVSDTEGEDHPHDEYSHMDAFLDPEGDDLPRARWSEVRSAAVTTRRMKNTPIRDVVENRDLELEVLRAHAEEVPAPEPEPDELDPANVPDLDEIIRSRFDFVDAVRKGYANDRLCSKVLAAPEQFANYTLENELLFVHVRGTKVLVVPDVLVDGRRLPEIVLSQAHDALGHLGTRKTLAYLRRWFWWPNIVSDCDAFVAQCPRCQVAKASTMRPAGLLHTLPVPTRPWESIGMDFLGPFVELELFNYCLLFICRLTGQVHLAPTRTDNDAVNTAWIDFREVVRLHGLSDSHVTDRDPIFVAKFWREMLRLLGTRQLMSTAFHPQTDGSSERGVRTTKQILRATIDANQRNWVQMLPMVEFAINSSISSTTGFAPFELNYGFMPRLVTLPVELTPFEGVREFVELARQNLAAAHDHIIAERVFQTHYANKRRRVEPAITEGSMVYLSRKDVSMPKGRARSLVPLYIGPYKVLEAYPESSNYRLELPDELQNRRKYDTFHVSKLRPHIAHEDSRFPNRNTAYFYDLGNYVEGETEVVDIVDHMWTPRLMFQVQWIDGDITWIPNKEASPLAALDRYLALHNVTRTSDLPRGNRKRGR